MIPEYKCRRCGGQFDGKPFAVRYSTATALGLNSAGTAQHEDCKGPKFFDTGYVVPGFGIGDLVGGRAENEWGYME